jgi:hypothetical protein
MRIPNQTSQPIKIWVEVDLRDVYSCDYGSFVAQYARHAETVGFHRALGTSGEVPRVHLDRQRLRVQVDLAASDGTLSELGVALYGLEKTSEDR